MKIVAAVLTFNSIKFDRVELVKKTVESLCAELDQRDVVLFDNGSSDGSFEQLQNILDCDFACDTRPGCAGAGMNRAIERVLANKSPDIVLFSNDDVYWRPGWRKKIEAFWSSARPSNKLAGGIIEPEWGWNTILGSDVVGGQKVLYRSSVGGASWSFRACDWPLLGPVSEEGMGLGDDTLVCQKIAGKYQIAVMDLADHIGEDKSTWGNNPSKMGAPPIDLVKWGLQEKNVNAEFEMEAKALFKQRFAEVGLSYQPQLYTLVREIKPEVVVETGVRAGVSTRYILAALEKNGFGHLYSCDPSYKDALGALERFRVIEMGALPGVDRWVFLGKPSAEALVTWSGDPCWDIFLHDSEHSEKNMSLELELAWKNVKPGGWIVVNNYLGVPGAGHMTWQKFTERHGIPASDWMHQDGAAWLHKSSEVREEVEQKKEPAVLRGIRKTRDPLVVVTSASPSLVLTQRQEEKDVEKDEDPPEVRAKLASFGAANLWSGIDPDEEVEDDEDDEDDEGDEDEDDNKITLDGYHDVWTEDDCAPDAESLSNAWLRLFNEPLETKKALKTKDVGDADLYYMPNGRVACVSYPGNSAILEKSQEKKMDAKR